MIILTITSTGQFRVTSESVTVQDLANLDHTYQVSLDKILRQKPTQQTKKIEIGDIPIPNNS